MTKPPISLQELRRQIYYKAKSDKTHRCFHCTPQVGTLTPSTVISPPGMPQIFTTSYSDRDGAEDLKYANFPSGDNGANGMWVRYVKNTNTLLMFNDAGTAPLPTICTPRSKKTVSNSRGTHRTGGIPP